MQEQKNGSFSLIERVILSAGAMLIFSVSSAPLRGGWTGAAGRAHARLAALSGRWMSSQGVKAWHTFKMLHSAAGVASSLGGLAGYSCC